MAMRQIKRIKLTNLEDQKASQAVPVKDSEMKMKLAVRILTCRTMELLKN
jgi:hypothetical protein